MALQFDKNYWPVKTPVEKKPYDLDELWEDAEDQATLFVAEALIADAPHMSFQTSSDANITVYLWSVGGDTIILEEPLTSLIDLSQHVYDKIRSEEQATDVRNRIAALGEVEASISRAKQHLENQLKDWPKHPSPKSPSPEE